jgi:hypothetical protein
MLLFSSVCFFDFLFIFSLTFGPLSLTELLALMSMSWIVIKRAILPGMRSTGMRNEMNEIITNNPVGK